MPHLRVALHTLRRVASRGRVHLGGGSTTAHRPRADSSAFRRTHRRDDLSRRWLQRPVQTLIVSVFPDPFGPESEELPSPDQEGAIVDRLHIVMSLGQALNLDPEISSRQLHQHLRRGITPSSKMGLRFSPLRILMALM